MFRLGSPLGRVAIGDPISKDELLKMAERVWRERGVAVIWPEDIVNEFDRQAVINAATGLYGERGRNGKAT